MQLSPTGARNSSDCQSILGHFMFFSEKVLFQLYFTKITKFHANAQLLRFPQKLPPRSPPSMFHWVFVGLARGGPKKPTLSKKCGHGWKWSKMTDVPSTFSLCASELTFSCPAPARPKGDNEFPGCGRGPCGAETA